VVEEDPVVGDHHHRAAEIADQAFEPQDAVDVQVVGRLVEEQHLRLAHQRPGQRHPLDAAARQAADHRLARQPELAQHLLDALLEAPGLGILDPVLQVFEPRQGRLAGVIGHRQHRGVVIHQQLGHVAEAVGHRGEHAALEGKSASWGT
jgi:hypothetical protein